jgi:hypothetical protein
MTCTTKYNIGQRVYIYTKSGLNLQTIFSLFISIDNKGIVRVYYRFNEYGDSYEESEIIEDFNKAKKALKSNMNQLQLALPEGGEK